IERDLGEAFEAYGYVPLDPPMVEQSNGGPAMAGDRLMRFLDRDGALVALRPDITTAVARLVAQRYAGAEGALRLSYFAPVFREETAMLGTEREYLQAGVELVGPGGPLADAEVLALLAESLARAGLRGHTIEVGHVGLVRDLFADLGEDAREGVLSLLRRGDFVGAFACARGAGMGVAAFGADRRATGFAIDVPRLHLALFASGWRPQGDRVLIALAPAGAMATARVASALRAQGLAVAVGAVAESAGLTVINAAVRDAE